MGFKFRTNEEFKIRADFHGSTYLIPGIWALLMTPVLIGAFVPNGFPEATFVLYMTFLIIGSGPIIYTILKNRCKDYTVTSQRLYAEQGIVSKKRKDIPLNKINDLEVFHGISQRMFGAGDMIKHAAFFLLLLLPTYAFGSYQCGNKPIVYEGDSFSTVKAKCGAPFAEGQNSITYNPGYGKFYDILIFQDDKFVKVKSGSRVTQIDSASEDHRGCCSSHGGITNECRNGKIVCRDRTLSPSCGC